jgi:hypothetical protein
MPAKSFYNHEQQKKPKLVTIPIKRQETEIITSAKKVGNIGLKRRHASVLLVCPR